MRRRTAFLTLFLVLSLGTVGCGSRSGLLRDYAAAIEHQRSGLNAEAQTAYAAILARDPAFEGVHNNLALIAADSGRLEDALTEIDRELVLHPTSVSARTNQVAVLLRLRGPGAARQKAEALVALGKANATAYLLLGLSHLAEGGDSARALRALEEAADHGTERVRAEARFARGIARARSGDMRGAEVDFGAAAELRRDAVAHFNRAVCLSRLGEFSEAEAALGRAKALDPKGAPVPILEARIALERMDYPSAEASSEAAVALGAGSEALLIRGWARLQAGKLREAGDDFAAADRVTPSSSAAYGRALLAVQQGDLRAAQSEFARVAELEPGHATALKNRNALSALLGPAPQ